MKTFKKTFDFYVTDAEIDNYVHSIIQSPEVDAEDEIDVSLHVPAAHYSYYI